jgi:hypothetical protein
MARADNFSHAALPWAKRKGVGGSAGRCCAKAGLALISPPASSPKHPQLSGQVPAEQPGPQPDHCAPALAAAGGHCTLQYLLPLDPRRLPHKPQGGAPLRARGAAERVLHVSCYLLPCGLLPCCLLPCCLFIWQC